MWKKVERPDYFGRRRDEKIVALNERFGKDKWQLMWVMDYKSDALKGGPHSDFYTFEEACRLLYEESYFRYLQRRPEDVDLICSYKECYDNNISNINSGCNYMIQEAYSTHIQDIAVRNVLRRLERKFGDCFPSPPGKTQGLLQIRSKDSEGFRFGPGNVPFAWPEMITQPSLAPRWANAGSVEDAWQSLKWIVVPA